ncbi:MAG: phosphatase PAP2 family protein [Patescibacteria group bacterium]
MWQYFRKCWLIVLFVILALITTTARVMGGVHYPGDILGGFFFGAIGAIILARYVITLELFERRVYPFFIRIAGWIKL